MVVAPGRHRGDADGACYSMGIVYDGLRMCSRVREPHIGMFLTRRAYQGRIFRIPHRTPPTARQVQAHISVCHRRLHRRLFHTGGRIRAGIPGKLQKAKEDMKQQYDKKINHSN